MRVTHLYPFFHQPGGVERYLREITRELAKHCEQELVSTESVTDPQFVMTRRLGVMTRPYFLAALTFSIASQIFLRRHKTDIVHAQGASCLKQDIVQAHSCHKAWFLSSFKALPWFSSRKWLKILNPTHYFTILVESIQFRRGNYKRVIAISKIVARDLERYYQVPSAKISIVYSGVNCTEFHPSNRDLFRDQTRVELGLRPGDICGIFVANEFRRKGLAVVVEALALLKNPSFKILVLGRDAPQAYQDLARKLGVAAQVIFAGSQQSLARYYAAADYFVFPTQHDAFGLVMTEAMAAGLPVITSPEAGATELIEHGREGYILKDIHSSREIADYMTAMADPNTRGAMAKLAREKAEQHDWKKCGEEIFAIYQQLLSDRTRSNGVPRIS